MSNIRSSFFMLFFSMVIVARQDLTGPVEALAAQTSVASPNMNDACYAPTQPLTIPLRKAFVDEVKALAVKAEKNHGVPAAIIAAMAINESGYGTTQLAIAAHNVLSYKWNSKTGPGGRRVFELTCQPKADSGNTYVVFRDRADSADFVADKLATSRYYKTATAAYRKAIADGQDRKAAATAWFKAIAPTYNPYESDKYIAAVLKVADDPIEQSEKLDETENLWLLASAQEHAKSAVATHDANVAAVVKAQKAAYALTEATNGCPAPAMDILGWPAAVVRECVYSKGPKANRLTGYVLLVDVKSETIATWIETACSMVLPSAGKCFQNVLDCGLRNSGMMFPLSGNMLEDMGNKPWENFFFRNGMTVAIGGQSNGTTEQVHLDRQKELALMPDTEITRIPSGVTRFWRTTPGQFAARFPSEAIPRSLTTPQDRQKWLNIARSEFLAALERPNNRLLEAWIAAHPQTLAAGTCPNDKAP